MFDFDYKTAQENFTKTTKAFVEATQENLGKFTVKPEEVASRIETAQKEFFDATEKNLAQATKAATDATNETVKFWREATDKANAQAAEFYKNFKL